MTFTDLAQDVRVDDGHILRARLQRADQEWQDAEIDLNQFIGNENGSFSWGGQGFSDSSNNINFSLEQDGAVPVLRASLVGGDGNQQDRDINLNERLYNNDGNFEFH